MLKLTKTIVDGKRTLIGFMIKGKEKEFGGFSTNEIEKGVPVPRLVKEKFNNNQIAIINNKIVEKSTFKINSLPMVVFTNNGYVDIDNTINLVGRYVQDNENVGFRVKFSDGSEDNITYANVIMLSKWFRPGNFSIRNSAKGKQYICGKKGGPNLEDLPATTIGDKPEVQPKRMKSAAKEAQTAFSGAIESGYDIIDIYNFISDCNGCVINLPSENYEAATENGETTLDSFTSLGIGEVAQAKPMFNATKINVNASFKKVGMVPVEINGTKQNITTFVYRTKSLFLNGENYIKKFGIAVPTDKEAELVKLLGRSLALEKIEDSSITSPLGQVIDAKSLSFYKVDSSKLDLISKEKIKDSVLNAKQIVAICKKMYDLKLVSKAVGPRGPIQKELKETLGEDGVAQVKNQKPFGIFAMMNEESLKAVSEAGIDIYTGAYTVAGDPVAKKANSESDSDDYEEPVTIEYILKGYDASKLTGAKVIEAVKANATDKVSESVIKLVNDVLNVKDDSKRLAAAIKTYNATEKKIEELNKKLWMHNASMYLAGGKKRIHTHDSKNWVVDTTTRVKNATVFACNSKGAEGLTVKFTGVEI